MEPLVNFFKIIFDTSGFAPRWYCGSAWTPLLGWTHIISDIGIFIAYIAIPLSLVFLVWLKREVHFTGLLWLFAAFITFCGFTHLIEASIFWHPWYRLSALVKFLTAIVSLGTAYILIRNLPLALNLPNIVRKKEDLENVIENLAVALFVINNKGEILFNNKEAAFLTKLKNDELLKKPIKDLFPKRLQNYIGKALSQAQQDKKLILIKSFLLGKNNKFIPVELDFTIFREGNKTQILLLIKDLRWEQEVKRAKHWQEEERKKSEKFFEDFYENAPDMFASISNEGWRITKCNTRLTEITGFTKGEIIGKHVYEVYHEDCKKELEEAADFYIKNEFIENAELELKTKNGSKVPVILNVTPVKDEEGNILYARAVWRDISSLKEAYKQIKEMNIRLLTKRQQLETLSNRLNAILNGTGEGIIMLSEEGIIEEFNKGAEAIFQYKAEEVIGKEVTSTLNPPARFENIEVRRLLKERVSKINPIKEELGLKKDGTIFFMEYLLSEVFIEGQLKYVVSIREITERKQIETKLAYAYEELLTKNHQLETLTNRLNAVLNSTADGIITINKEGLIESFNHSAEEIFLYKAEEVIGKSSSILSGTNDSIPKPEEFEERLRALVTYDNIGREVMTSKKDGIFFPIEFLLNEIVIDGETKFIASVRDITQRKQIEAKLSSAYQELLIQKQQFEYISIRLNAILNSTADAIITINEEGIIESLNHAAEEMFQYSEEEAIGKQSTFLAAPDKREKLDKIKAIDYLNALSKKSIGTNVEWTCQKKDGTIFPTEFTLCEIEIEGKRKYISNIRDITERKKIEKDLKDAYENLLQQKQQFEAISNRLNAILDGTVDGMITIDDHGLIEAFNPAAERIFLYKAKEVIGKNVKILMPQTYSKDHDKYIKNYLNTRQPKIINSGREVEGMRKDGTIFPLDLSVSEIKVENEIKFTGIVRDISQRKEMEDKLKVAYQELEEFVYIASHDLKEPLRGIHNYSTFLIEDYENILDQDGKDKLYTLKFLTTRLDKFIDDLLYYSRVGKTDLSIKKVDLNEVVEDVISSIKINLDEKKISLKIHDLPALVCDKTRVTEVFRNLITNAMKYNDKDDKWIDIGYEIRKNQYNKDIFIFHVKDNGIGIDKRYYDSIFKIFKRLHGREKFGGGSGAGLTIAKKIVNQHGGEIWVESVPKEGTTFYFTLQENKEDV